jgi:hypothetical protein
LAKHNIFKIAEGLLAKVKEKVELEEQKRQRINVKTVELEKKKAVRLLHERGCCIE